MPVPLPVIADTFRTAFKWTHAATGQTAVNVMHFKRTAASGATPSDLFEALQDAITANQWTAVQSGASITEVDITPLDGTSATNSFLTGAGAQWTGGSGGDFVPQVAMIVKLQTNLRGRNHRGRVFLPFMSEAGIASGLADPTNVAVAQTAWALLQTTLQADAGPGGPWNQVVAAYDRRHGGAGAAATLITTYVVERALATQRRRQERLR